MTEQGAETSPIINILKSVLNILCLFGDLLNVLQCHRGEDVLVSSLFDYWIIGCIHHKFIIATGARSCCPSQAIQAPSPLSIWVAFVTEKKPALTLTLIHSAIACAILSLRKPNFSAPKGGHKRRSFTRVNDRRIYQTCYLNMINSEEIPSSWVLFMQLIVACGLLQIQLDEANWFHGVSGTVIDENNDHRLCTHH